MPSPFPGMDPYLEAQPFWGVLQGSLIAAMKAALKHRVPPEYTIWSDIHTWLHEPDAESRLVKPDVFLASQSEGDAPTATLTAPVTTILPAMRREGNKYLKIKE